MNRGSLAFLLCKRSLLLAAVAEMLEKTRNILIAYFISRELVGLSLL
jgi:hypothetical protein